MKYLQRGACQHQTGNSKAKQSALFNQQSNGSNLLARVEDKNQKDEQDVALNVKDPAIKLEFCSRNKWAWGPRLSLQASCSPGSTDTPPSRTVLARSWAYFHQSPYTLLTTTLWTPWDPGCLLFVHTHYITYCLKSVCLNKWYVSILIGYSVIIFPGATRGRQ